MLKMAFSVNSKGELLFAKKLKDESLQESVLGYIIAGGGDPAPGFFPGKYSDVAVCFRVSSSAERRECDHMCSPFVV